MKSKKRKNPNAGMTLLEVIIAVSIFSITAIVLLKSFVTSGKINLKSNLYLEATTVAQNLMEEIKAKSFEKVSLAFNYPFDTDGTTRLTFLNSQKDRIESGTLGIREVLKSGDSYKDVSQYRDGMDESKVTASVISEDGGKTYKFNPRKKGDNASKYYFELTDVNVNKETFDVLAEFDGSQTSGYKKKTTTGKGDGKNDYLAPNIAKMDTKTNAFLIMPQNWDEKAMRQLTEAQKMAAVEKMNTDNPGSGESFQPLDWEEVYKSTRRTLYIKIEESAGTIKAEAKYTLCAYDYSRGDSEYATMGFCPCGGRGEEGDDIYPNCFCTYKSAYVPFYSSEAGEDLKNIFVFYYPNYNSKSAVNPFDKIVLDNTTNYDVNFYVTKQRDEASQIPTSSQESQYRMSLTVLENPAARNKTNWNTNTGLYRAVTKLRTNLDYNISDMDQVLSRPKIGQMTLTYQAVNSSGSDGARVSGNAAKKVLDYNSLADQEEEDRIYTAKISVYKAGAAEKGFPDSDLVVTLDGSKED